MPFLAVLQTYISIHALLAESDPPKDRISEAEYYFYPRSPCGERPGGYGCAYLYLIISIHALLAESDGQTGQGVDGSGISIHALLAESDLILSYKVLLATLFLSTLSLRRATRGWTLNINGPMKISIHALLAESDPPVREIIQWEGIFLSTLSLRRATLAGPSGPAFLFNFYPRSPCGERHVDR